MSVCVMGFFGLFFREFFSSVNDSSDLVSSSFGSIALSLLVSSETLLYIYSAFQKINK